MRIKYAGKLSIFLCIEVQQIFSCPFSLLKHYQMPECFYVNNCGFELAQQFYHATEIGTVARIQARQREPVAEH